jgi:hypothetical protein
MTTAGSWTMEGWFRLDDVTHNFDQLCTTRNQGPHGDNLGWNLFYAQNLDKLAAVVQTSSGTFSLLTEAGVVNDQAWHHVALVWDHDQGASGQVRLYLDGELDDFIAGPAGLPTGPTATRYLSVGVQHDGQWDDLPWLGQIDEFRWTDGQALLGLRKRRR